MDKTTRYMQRAFELAELARGRCSPNPFVGAVIVKNDTIIGEGFTQPYGSDHAEVQAIKHCTESCRDAEMYITLEPCSHYGKTPPCAKAIIESGIKSVYIGITDPNPLVKGKGIQMLKDAGITVETGFLEDVITRQLEYYLTYITRQKPFVILKSAISLDGRIAAQDGSSRWISGTESRQKTHELRQEVDAIITGIGTVLKDNPLLNVRLDNPYKQPIRVVLDAKLSIEPSSNIAQSAHQQKTLVFSSSKYTSSEKVKPLEQSGIEVVILNENEPFLNLSQVLTELYNRKISVVMVEAGTQINTSFILSRLVDKFVIFIAPKLLGGTQLAWQDIDIDNIKDALNLTNMEIMPSGTDLMLTAYPDYHR